MQSPASVPERRKWERLPISIPFFVRGKMESGQEFLEFVSSINLCAGGALLAIRHYLEVGTEISLEVPVALTHKAHMPQSASVLRATVLRCIRDRHYFLLALQFSEPLIHVGTSPLPKAG